MKYFACSILFLACACSADDITTLSGTTYQNIKLLSTEPDGITFKHSSGVAKLKYNQMPEELQKQYGYDPEKEKAWLEANRAAAGKPAENRATAQQLVQQGQLYLNAGKFAEAVQCLEKVVSPADKSSAGSPKGLLIQSYNSWLQLLYTARAQLASQMASIREAVKTMNANLQQSTSHLSKMTHSGSTRGVGSAGAATANTLQVSAMSLAQELNKRNGELAGLQQRLAVVDAQIADLQTRLQKFDASVLIVTQAKYGTNDVTAAVRALVRGNKLTANVSPAALGLSADDSRQMLQVSYLVQGQPKAATVADGGALALSSIDPNLPAASGTATASAKTESENPWYVEYWRWIAGGVLLLYLGSRMFRSR